MSAPVRNQRKPAPPTSLPLAKVKATLSAVVNIVEQKRIPVTILRRGVPVARIVPVEHGRAPLFGSMRGTARELGDIVHATGVEWTLKETDE